jgi:hypothetical protein
MSNTNVILSQINSSDIDTVNYNTDDINLLNGTLILRQFGQSNDYIEQVLYDISNNIVNIEYDYINQSIENTLILDNTTNEINIDPVSDLAFLGYTSGEFKILYNFFRKKITDGNTNPFYIKDISSDRTEIRVVNNNISNSQLQTQVQGLINEIQNTAYHKDYILNFGNNNLVIAVNVALEQNPTQFSILFKLYKPLPQSIKVKDTFWVVEQVADPIQYNLTATKYIEPVQIPSLRSPNFDIEVNNNINQPSSYENIDSLSYNNSNVFFQQINGLLDTKNIQINIDYNDYNNFVHFSSAKERLLNFTYKLKLIEGYSNELSVLNNIPSSSIISAVSGNINITQEKVNEIINKFDGYERFLYYGSSSISGSTSNPWPKQNANIPYTLYSITSSQAISYLGSDESESLIYGGQILSASLYDVNNQDNLIYTIPEFIRENDDNINYLIFLNMIGQHFDNVWTYSKSITDLYDAKNKLTEGISKDLVSYALKSLGVKLYTNEKGGDNIFDYLLGFDPNNSIPNPLTTTYTLPSNQTFNLNNLTISSTGTLIVPSTTTVNIALNLTNAGTIINNNVINAVNFINTGVILNNTVNIIPQSFITNLISYSDITGEDYNKEIYKRIYHNLPLLFKAKGTERGLRALISCYGIPDTILRISETGGADKSKASIEYNHNRFSYGFRTSGSINNINIGEGNIRVPLYNINANFSTGSYNNYTPYPTAYELRFKPDQLENITTIYSQSILEVYANDQMPSINSNPTGSPSSKIILEKDPSVHKGLKENYGYLYFYINSGSLGNYFSSSKIELPFFDGSYYNILYHHKPLPVSSSVELIAKSSYEDYINHQGSSSIFFPSSTFPSFSNTQYIVLGGVGPVGTPNVPQVYFKGALQEFRCWSQPLEQSTFNYHVLNPESYEGNTTGSSYDTLVLRLPLGSDLNILNNAGDYLITNHPSYPQISSYTISSLSGSFISGTLSQSFEPIVEKYYYDSPYTGILERVNNKIRIPSSSLPHNFLSPIIRAEEISDADLTQDIHLMEIAFSPQNEINDDIISQLGFFNIDNYIGNPQEETLDKYPDLESLKTFYFQKYLTNYNIFDYIRLIKYFDNSLFKMIKDYIPARANASTGILIKPHILERNKQPRLPLEGTHNDYTSSIKIVETSGDSGGVFDTELNQVSSSLMGNLGLIYSVNTFNEEYYTGEITGTIIKSINGPANPFAKPNYN